LAWSFAQDKAADADVPTSVAIAFHVSILSARKAYALLPIDPSPR